MTATRPPRPAAGTVDLTRLQAGDRARVERTSLERADLAILESLGLTEASELRVCRAGDPCILQVRSTRIGLAEAVAKSIFVVPEER